MTEDTEGVENAKDDVTDSLADIRDDLDAAKQSPEVPNPTEDLDDE